MLKMVSIIQGVHAVYQNPSNFGTTLGQQIVGAKVSCVQPLHRATHVLQIQVSDNFGFTDVNGSKLTCLC